MKSFCYLTSKLQQSVQTYKKFVLTSYNKFDFQFLKLLCFEGLLSNIEYTNTGKLKIFLKYSTNGMSTFTKIKVLSKPGKLVFVTYSSLTKMDLGVGLLIVSTNKGLMTHHSCIKLKIGGTALCYIK